MYFVMQEKSSGRGAHYKLTSTVMLWLQTNKCGSGLMSLGGSLTRQVCHIAIYSFALCQHLVSLKCNCFILLLALHLFPIIVHVYVFVKCKYL